MRRIIGIDDRDRLLLALDTLRTSVVEGRTHALAIATDDGDDGTGYLIAARDEAITATLFGAVALLEHHMAEEVLKTTQDYGAAE